MSNLAQNIPWRIRQFLRTMSMWLFGDLLYAVLPLIVLAIVTTLLGKTMDDFLLLKEWSFANIVLFGVVIRKFIQVKVSAQLDVRSHTLDVGVQFYILLVIVSVLILALILLVEQGVIPHEAANGIGRAQMGLFII